MPIDDAITRMHDEVASWRRDIHAHPELAFEERRTSRLVAQKLKEAGLEVTTGIAETGVVGSLQSGKSKRAIALRADIDALPLQENNSFAHRSQHPGKMHACGHDGHTAMLLGAARYLARAPHFDGTVHFVFQPAEEGGGGGQRMVDEGLFQRFDAEAVFAIHNWPGIPVGSIATRPGPIMAAFDRFEVQVHGQGCHAAMPHLGVDPVTTGATLVSALQTVVARKLDPLDSAVLSTTQFHAGDDWSIIPEKATLRGTVRSFRSEVSQQIERELSCIAERICASAGARAEVKYERKYPPTINDAEQARFAAQVAAELVGEDNVQLNLNPSMGAEDFAFMLKAKPGAYIWLGNGPTEGSCLLHNPNYDFNDEIIPLGMAYWAKLARDFLSS